eukprot:1154577-Pelagomonas_calceolata.AAC.1
MNSILYNGENNEELLQKATWFQGQVAGVNGGHQSSLQGAAPCQSAAWISLTVHSQYQKQQEAKFALHLPPNLLPRCLQPSRAVSNMAVKDQAHQACACTLAKLPPQAGTAM